MNVPMCLMAKLLKRHGAPVYFYLYDLRNLKTNSLPYHGADVAFMFNNRSLIPNQPPDESLPSPSRLVQSMIFDSFQNFIKTGAIFLKQLQIEQAFEYILALNTLKQQSLMCHCTYGYITPCCPE
uniref:Carboxylesterase type B domain-containing protein n=1 Tax=Romanomermis culicivorax TaxID=13658 RepID=A0A915I435_ROMCU